MEFDFIAAPVVWSHIVHKLLAIVIYYLLSMFLYQKVLLHVYDFLDLKIPEILRHDL